MVQVKRRICTDKTWFWYRSNIGLVKVEYRTLFGKKKSLKRTAKNKGLVQVKHTTIPDKNIGIVQIQHRTKKGKHWTVSGEI